MGLVLLSSSQLVWTQWAEGCVSMLFESMSIACGSTVCEVGCKPVTPSHFPSPLPQQSK